MPRKYDPLDRRQRVAATILMSAVDLPQPMSAYGKLALEAASLCPGVTIDEIGWGHGRRSMLAKAKQLIEDMLNESV